MARYVMSEGYVWRAGHTADPELSERIRHLYFTITGTTLCNSPQPTARIVKDYQL